MTAAVALLGSGASLVADKAQAATPHTAAASQAPAGARTATLKPVDINSASRAELMALPGIGKAQADRIIAGRPYLSKARLVADNVLSDEAYRALKGRIVALQKTQPKAKP